MDNSLLGALTTVNPGDDVADVASAARINAIQAILKALIRGDNIMTGPNILKKSQDGWVILSGQPTGKKGGSDGPDHPFKVGTRQNEFTGNTELTILPGEIVSTKPTLYGESLVADPRPVYSPPVGAFTLVLRVDLDNTITFPVAPRYAVTTASIVNANDSTVVADVVNGVLPELKVKWGDDGTVVADKTKGHFYIKVAECLSTLPAQVIQVEVTQYLAQNYRTLAVIGDEVVLLA